MAAPPLALAALRLVLLVASLPLSCPRTSLLPPAQPSCARRIEESVADVVEESSTSTKPSPSAAVAGSEEAVGTDFANVPSAAAEAAAESAAASRADGASVAHVAPEAALASGAAMRFA